MCDYSLGEIRNRLAIEGEELVVHRFPTHSVGLASPAELRPTPSPQKNAPSLWERIRTFFTAPAACGNCMAVCIPPGALLTLRNIPSNLQHKWEVREEESVVFVQTSAEVNRYRDAISFPNGRVVSLQNLIEGMLVKVVSLGGERVDEVEPFMMVPNSPPEVGVGPRA